MEFNAIQTKYQQSTDQKKDFLKAKPFVLHHPPDQVDDVVTAVGQRVAAMVLLFCPGACFGIIGVSPETAGGIGSYKPGIIFPHGIDISIN